jgi:hypothetical protein
MRHHIHLGRSKGVHLQHLPMILHTHHLLHSGRGTMAHKKEGGRMVSMPREYPEYAKPHRVLGVKGSAITNRVKPLKFKF